MTGANQALLFPDPQPLVERLGRDFFRQAPVFPGVYLMRDARDTVVYVGKAKNLRQRLRSYRIANPDRMPRRHLRMLRLVVRIEFEQCRDESAALAREAELLRSLKPRFNRMGTWSAPSRAIGWRCTDEGLELALTSSSEEEFERLEPLAGGAKHFFKALVRLLWCALNPQRGTVALPPGWIRGRIGERVVLAANRADIDECVARLGGLFAGGTEAFVQWVTVSSPAERPFEISIREADLETVAWFAGKRGVTAPAAVRGGLPDT